MRARQVGGRSDGSRTPDLPMAAARRPGRSPSAKPRLRRTTRPIGPRPRRTRRPAAVTERPAISRDHARRLAIRNSARTQPPAGVGPDWPPAGLPPLAVGWLPPSAASPDLSSAGHPLHCASGTPHQPATAPSGTPPRPAHRDSPSPSPASGRRPVGMPRRPADPRDPTTSGRWSRAAVVSARRAVKTTAHLRRYEALQPPAGPSAPFRSWGFPRRTVLVRSPLTVEPRRRVRSGGSGYWAFIAP